LRNFFFGSITGCLACSMSESSHSLLTAFSFKLPAIQTL
jgi:hypothetical protein